MSVRDKCRVWFFSGVENDLLNEEAPTNHPPVFRSEQDNTPMGAEDHEVIREEVRKNRRIAYENRVRIGKIDERTAFIARMVFGLFLAFIASVGSGMVLAFAF